MSNLNSVLALDPARARVKPHILVPPLSMTRGQIRGYSHVNLLCFGIDDGPLSETRVWPTGRRKIRPSLIGHAALGVVDPQVCQILVLPLSSEDEYRLAGRLEKHGMTCQHVSTLTWSHRDLGYQTGGVSVMLQSPV